MTASTRVALSRYDAERMARNPTLEQDVRRFNERFAELLMQYQFRDRERICVHGITLTQCYVLQTLDGPTAMNIVGLATALMLDKSTMSRTVSQLRRRQLVACSRDPGEHRSQIVSLTVAGRKLHRRIAREIRAEQRELLRAYSSAFRQEVCVLLERLLAIAQPRLRRGRRR